MGQDSPINIAADRYQIEGEIGRGGMGVVLRAHDRVLNIRVAIKVLGSDHTGLGAARLQREATAAGKLTHQNIARILDFGQTSDSIPYMVMEYLEGQSLSDLIKIETRLEWRKALPIFAQLASATSYAHQSGVIHRDIKPSNVILVDWGTAACQAKLLDFGVAKIFDTEQTLTRTGAISGSPLYMSPEQANGDSVTNASDIYSFGCLMFETLTGEVPFRGGSALETLSMHRNSAPPLLTDLISVQKLPGDLVTLVDECLRKAPENRPADFAEISRRIEEIADKSESRTLTAEQIQKISNQHFKIRIHHFWKSNFGLTAIVASLFVLCGLGFSVFQSEQKLVEEIKMTPKAVSQGNVVKECLDVEQQDDEPFNYISTTNGLQAVSKDVTTDDSMTQLTGKKLYNLCLNHGSYNGSGLAHVNPQLSCLTIANLTLRDDNLRYLEPMKSLILVSLTSSNMTDKDLRHIAKLKALREVRICSDLITNEGIAQISGLPDLDFLVIESSGITDDISHSLLKMKKLRKLYLNDTSIGSNFLQRLASLQHLDALSLGGMKTFSDGSLSSLHNFKKLTALHISGNVLNESAFVSISKMSNINRLALGDAKFDPKHLRHLQNMPNLRHLDLWQNKNITNDLIQEIIQLKQLEDVNFNETNLTESQFLKMTRMRNLTRIMAFDSKVNQEACKIFMDAFTRIWKKPCIAEASAHEGIE